MRNFLYAIRPLAVDFLGMIAFAALIAAHAPILLAASVAGAIALAVILWQAVRREKIAPLQWLSLISVVGAGALALMTNDPRYLMAKPSIIYLAVSATMLQRGWMLRYVPPKGQDLVGDLMVAFGYVWAGLMFVTAVANLVVAVAWPDIWPAFVAIFPLASKALLFAVHFGWVSAQARLRLQTHSAAVQAEG
jgi:intracellular septation protein A